MEATEKQRQEIQGKIGSCSKTLEEIISEFFKKVFNVQSIESVREKLVVKDFVKTSSSWLKVIETACKVGTEDKESFYPEGNEVSQFRKCYKKLGKTCQNVASEMLAVKAEIENDSGKSVKAVDLINNYLLYSVKFNKGTLAEIIKILVKDDSTVVRNLRKKIKEAMKKADTDFKKTRSAIDGLKESSMWGKKRVSFLSCAKEELRTLLKWIKFTLILMILVTDKIKEEGSDKKKRILMLNLNREIASCKTKMEGILADNGKNISQEYELLIKRVVKLLVRCKRLEKTIEILEDKNDKEKGLNQLKAIEDQGIKKLNDETNNLVESLLCLVKGDPPSEVSNGGDQKIRNLYVDYTQKCGILCKILGYMPDDLYKTNKESMLNKLECMKRTVSEIQKVCIGLINSDEPAIPAIPKEGTGFELLKQFSKRHDTLEELKLYRNAAQTLDDQQREKYADRYKNVLSFSMDVLCSNLDTFYSNKNIGKMMGDWKYNIANELIEMKTFVENDAVFMSSDKKELIDIIRKYMAIAYPECKDNIDLLIRLKEIKKELADAAKRKDNDRLNELENELKKKKNEVSKDVLCSLPFDEQQFFDEDYFAEIKQCKDIAGQITSLNSKLDAINKIVLDLKDDDLGKLFKELDKMLGSIHRLDVAQPEVVNAASSNFEKFEDAIGNTANYELDYQELNRNKDKTIILFDPIGKIVGNSYDSYIVLLAKIELLRIAHGQIKGFVESNETASKSLDGKRLDNMNRFRGALCSGHIKFPMKISNKFYILFLKTHMSLDTCFRDFFNDKNHYDMVLKLTLDVDVELKKIDK